MTRAISTQPPTIRSTSVGIGGLRSNWKKNTASQAAPPPPTIAHHPIKHPAQLAKTPNTKKPAQARAEREDSDIGTGPDGGALGLDEDDSLLDAVGDDKEVQGSNKSHKNGTKSVRIF